MFRGEPRTSAQQFRYACVRACARLQLRAWTFVDGLILKQSLEQLVIERQITLQARSLAGIGETIAKRLGGTLLRIAQ